MPAVPLPDTAARRWAALLAAGALLSPLLAGCSSGGGREEGGSSGAASDVPTADRSRVAEGGTLRWAVDALPTTYNVFQPDAGPATDRVAEAALPALFTLDDRAEPRANPDYLESAEVTEREPKQTVVYKLNPEARWSDGKPVGAADFTAQWKALNGKNKAYWAARNAGYDRIASISQGEGEHEVKVVFAKPYGDWRSLFTPLYPRSVMGDPKAFNNGSRQALPAVAGPFRPGALDPKSGSTRLERNGAWWGERAKLSAIELKAVPRGEREAALASGALHYAEVGTGTARRVQDADSLPAELQNGKGGDDTDRDSRDDRGGQDGQDAGDDAGDAGNSAESRPSGKAGDTKKAEGSGDGKNAEGARARQLRARAAQAKLKGLRVRKALDPGYTQLALNGASTPLADERVRQAIVRAIDRGELAKAVLGPAGLPTKPLGSHLRMRDQRGYADNSGAVGGRSIDSARSLLSDAGWNSGDAPKDGPRTPASPGGIPPAGQEAEVDGKQDPGDGQDGKRDGQDEKPGGSAGERDGGGSPGGGTTEDRAVGGAGARALLAGSRGPLSPAPSVVGQRAALLEQAARAQLGAAEAQEGGTSAAPAGDAERLRSEATAYRAEARDERASAEELGLMTGAATAVRTKNGQPLVLDFVLPAGPGSEHIRATGERIARMLDGVGVRTRIKQVADDSFFKDHVAAGEYDLALYSWPGSAYPATDARPIFAKPEAAADGSLLVEQNYTRVGTDQIDRLFEEATGELDEGARRAAMRRADARIWAVAGSVPLFQRPQLVAASEKLVNAGAFGFQTPRYQDIGFRKS
ncbi:ABC transporter family substrate-binding protein [Streptomyces sp. AJS327]|uniref:ABC transporter substrate-binding protein n=1 Tax=Streptomyces sp. AJS327 TaxID=2545265 RepID=UPI0015E01D40|nr:ABC transporter substrate-binding protein [Streptomyces sp. AJS327]MBA0051388.1 ABC transporter family substrate-binding protein [Streptomyces sp. AJS327]